MNAARVALALMFLSSLVACSKKPATDAPAQSVAEDTRASAAGTAAEADAEGGGVERGTPCQQHDYRLKPGENQVLPFEVKIGQGPEVPPELTLNTKPLDGTSVGVDLMTTDYSTYRFPIWVIDARGAFAEMEQAGVSRPVATMMGSRQRISIAWTPDGYGHFMLHFDGRPDAEKTGAMSEEEVLEAFGTSASLGLAHLTQTYQTSLVRETGEGKVLVFRVGVNTPPDQESHQFLKHVTVHGGSVRTELTVGWNGVSRIYSISGPAQTAECFQ